MSDHNLVNENYYNEIVNLANIAIVKLDKNLIIIDFAGNARSIFGFNKEEVIGKNIFGTIVPKKDSLGRNLKTIFESLIKDSDSYRYNIGENTAKNGNRIWMQWFNQVIKDENEEVTAILSIGINITEHINLEKALKVSEERFKMLSDLTSEGIIIHDNGIILDVNLALEKQTGVSRDELIGNHLFDVLVPSENQLLMANELKKRKSKYEMTIRLRNEQKIDVYIESKMFTIGGRKVRVAAIRNISEQKNTIAELDRYKNRLEEIVYKRTDALRLQSIELKKQNELLQFERNQLRTIIDHVPDFIYIKDSNSRFLNANKSLIKYIGKRSLSEIIGKNDFDFFPNDLASEFYADEQKIIKDQVRVINKEERSTDIKGRSYFVLTTKVPLKDKDGNIRSIIGIGRDITEKQKAEDKLRQQTKDLKKANLLLEERSLRIEILNSELLESNKQLELINKVLNEKKEELELALEQLQSAQTHLIHSEKMASLGILMAGIAHEINNPVNFVYAGVNSLMKDFEDISKVIDEINLLTSQNEGNNPLLNKIEEIKGTWDFETAIKASSETLSDIKLGASRITEIVASLSRFSRLENEKWKSDNLHEELESVLVLLKNKYKHHVQIIKNFDISLPLVECCPGKINQVFMNVINNAIDALEGNPGTITIETNTNGCWAVVKIKDTGVGISDEDKPRIFDPFFTTKDVGFGMGLGLSISYSIIQEHHGKIKVNSVKDLGTEFIIQIPITQTKLKLQPKHGTKNMHPLYR